MYFENEEWPGGPEVGGGSQAETKVRQHRHATCHEGTGQMRARDVPGIWAVGPSLMVSWSNAASVTGERRECRACGYA